MGSTFLLPDNDQQTAEIDPSADVAAVQIDADEGDDEQRPESTGLRCEKCAAPFKSDKDPVCRSCGWYARLGTYVEVYPDWEEDDRQATGPPKLTHLQVWLNLLPRWAWIVIASVVAVVIESVVVRLATPAGSHLRTVWSLSQLTVGGLVFVGLHVFNFLTVAADDADMGVLDLVLKPFKTWVRTFAGLPARLWIVDAAACGLTAAVMSLVVIGGIPYHVLWNWGFKEPPKPNLMEAVVSQMQQSGDKGGADNLEDAVNDFAASQDLEPQQPEPKPTPPKPRQRADCVIVGYRVDGDGRITMLILAAEYRRKLVYAGQIAPQLTDDEMAELAEDLGGVKTKWPFLPIQTTAIWVDPKFTCRVTFDKRSTNGRLSDIKWDRLLGELHAP